MTKKELVKSITAIVHDSRVNRRVNPEGNFNARGLWYPSEREQGLNVIGRIRAPSNRYPYSYMLACRSRKHCAVLVERALSGKDVPLDVLAKVCAAVHYRVGLSNDCPVLIALDAMIDAGLLE